MATMNQDDRIMLFWLARNHFVRGCPARLLPYLAARVGVL